MDIEGVWRVEMLGVHDWEVVSTAFLEGGRYLGGGAHGYSVGRYHRDGDKVVIRAKVTLYVNGLTIFGRGSGRFEITYDAEAREGQLIGNVTDGQYSVHFRSIRVGDIP